MAWNPSREVAIARDLAPKLNADQVVVLYINRSEGTVRYASYGRTRELCADAKKIADVAFDAVMKRETAALATATGGDRGER